MLVRTGRGSEVRVVAPTQCAAGHSLKPPNVAVSTRTCWTDSGHIIWVCRTCDTVTYDEPCTDPAQLDKYDYGR